MMPELLILAFLAWLSLQFRRTRKPVWLRRRDRLVRVLGPWVRWVYSDVQATRAAFSTWRATRRLRRQTRNW